MEQIASLSTLYRPDQAAAVDDFDWQAHPTCPGVSLKHLLTSAETEGKFSLHLVRVEAGCQISEHIHATQAELHQVIGGSGQCQIENCQKMPYQPGTLALIPAGQKHQVWAANSEDLYLLATFASPLR